MFDSLSLGEFSFSVLYKKRLCMIFTHLILVLFKHFYFVKSMWILPFLCWYWRICTSYNSSSQAAFCLTDKAKLPVGYFYINPRLLRNQNTFFFNSLIFIRYYSKSANKNFMKAISVFIIPLFSSFFYVSLNSTLLIKLHVLFLFLALVSLLKFFFLQTFFKLFHYFWISHNIFIFNINRSLFIFHDSFFWDLFEIYYYTLGQMVKSSVIVHTLKKWKR